MKDKIGQKVKCKYNRKLDVIKIFFNSISLRVKNACMYVSYYKMPVSS